MKTMTAQSVVYREEQRAIAPGDRIQIHAADSEQGVRNGDLGTVVGMTETNGLEVRLDRGKTVQLSELQTRQIDHAYAVESLNAGAPERVLISHVSSEITGDSVSLPRSVREVSVYTSNGPDFDLSLHPSIDRSQQQEIASFQNPVAPEPAAQVQQRRGLGL